MAGEIQLNSTTFATESGGTVTVSNVDSATNRQNLGLEIGVDVQAFDTDTTKNDVANTFTANQIISVTDNTNAALRVTQLGTGNALVVEDSTNPDSTPFVVDASGNVGMGTSSPEDSLHISQSLPIIKLTDTDTGVDHKIVGHGSTGGFNFVIDANEVATDPYIGFQISNSNVMRIDSSGNLLVGASALTDTDGVIIQVNSGTGYGRINLKKTQSGTVTGLGFYHDNTSVGSVTYTNSTINFNQGSDYRLKENITKITDGITRVKQLSPSRFNYIVDPETTVDGFIAHEVSDIVPEAISGEKDAVDDDGNPEYQGIDQSKLVPLLTAALQESIALIETQQSQINALTARIEALETP